MKLIIAGSSGVIGARLIEQTRNFPAISSVIALSRRPITVDPSHTKVKNVIIPDYGEYPDDVKEELKDADACVWTVGITPMKSLSMEAADVRRISVDYTAAGFKAMYEAGPRKPFRFVYLSGKAVPDSPTEKPGMILGNFLNVRSEAEQTVRSFAASNDNVECIIACPGLITDRTTWARSAVSSFCGVINLAMGGNSVNVTTEELTTSILSAAIHGMKGDKLGHNDMITLGREGVARSK